MKKRRTLRITAFLAALLLVVLFWSHYASNRPIYLGPHDFVISGYNPADDEGFLVWLKDRLPAAVIRYVPWPKSSRKKGLWLVDSQTGTKTPLIKPSARFKDINSPLLSPDKRYVSFIADDSLRIYDLTTRKKRLLAHKVHDAIWADASRLLFLSRGKPPAQPRQTIIGLAHVSGETRLLHTANAEICRFLQAAGSEYCFYLSKPSGHAAAKDVSLYALKLRGEKIVEHEKIEIPTTKNESVEPCTLAFSPDGRYLAHVVINNLATYGIETRIIELDGIDFQESAPLVFNEVRPITWNPKRSQLLLLDPHKREVLLFSLGENSPRLLVAFPADTSLFPAGWSPDGKYIFYGPKKDSIQNPANYSEEIIFLDDTGKRIDKINIEKLYLESMDW